MITIAFVVVLIAVVAVFSVQNAAPVSISFLSGHFEASLSIIVLLSLLIGMVLGMTILPGIRLRRSFRKKNEVLAKQPQKGNHSKT